MAASILQGRLFDLDENEYDLLSLMLCVSLQMTVLDCLYFGIISLILNIAVFMRG